MNGFTNAEANRMAARLLWFGPVVLGLSFGGFESCDVLPRSITLTRVQPTQVFWTRAGQQYLMGGSERVVDRGPPA